MLKLPLLQLSLNAGLHRVTVTDSKGCTSECSVTINEPADNVSCTVIEDHSSSL